MLNLYGLVSEPQYERILKIASDYRSSEDSNLKTAQDQVSVILKEADPTKPADELEHTAWWLLVVARDLTWSRTAPRVSSGGMVSPGPIDTKEV